MSKLAIGTSSEIPPSVLVQRDQPVGMVDLPHTAPSNALLARGLRRRQGWSPAIRAQVAMALFTLVQ